MAKKSPGISIANLAQANERIRDNPLSSPEEKTRASETLVKILQMQQKVLSEASIQSASSIEIEKLAKVDLVVQGVQAVQEVGIRKDEDQVVKVLERIEKLFKGVYKNNIGENKDKKPAIVGGYQYPLLKKILFGKSTKEDIQESSWSGKVTGGKFSLSGMLEKWLQGKGQPAGKKKSEDQGQPAGKKKSEDQAEMDASTKSYQQATEKNQTDENATLTDIGSTLKESLKVQKDTLDAINNIDVSGGGFFGGMPKGSIPKGSVPKGGGVPKGAGKFGGMLGSLFAIGGGAFDAVGTLNEADEQEKSGSITSKQATVKRVGAVSGMAGGAATAIVGAEAGAVIGTAIFPVVGTAIGGLVGGLIGYWGGQKAGEFVGEKITEGVQRAESDNGTIGTIDNKNHNPLNVVDIKTGKRKQFNSLEEGQSAGMEDLKLKLDNKSNSYKAKFGNAPVTPQTLAGTWSPPVATGNTKESTDNYSKYIAKRLNIKTTDTINPNDIAIVYQAMAEFENNQKISTSKGRSVSGQILSPPTTTPVDAGVNDSSRQNKNAAAANGRSVSGQIINAPTTINNSKTVGSSSPFSTPRNPESSCAKYIANRCSY